MGKFDLDRREVLKIGAIGAIGVGVLAVPLGEQALTKGVSTLAPRNFPVPYAAAFRRPPVLKPYGETIDDTGRTLLYSVTEKQGTANILPGLTTTVWGYNGSLPGPTISIDQGTKVKLRMRNALPAAHPTFGHPFYTSTHLHGSASLPQFDGYASDITAVGSVKEYNYPNFQGARTLWYHDHAVHHTAQNAYTGLAAQYHMHDPYERGQLPQGEFDVPLTITDAMFAANGSISYDDKGIKSLWGDIVLVNGVPWPNMKVKRRVYRFRILVASISRSYRLRLSTGDPLTVVGTDGGMVPVPQPSAFIRQGSAERYEVLIDFSKYAVGTKVDLLNASNANNVNFDHTGKVMRFTVTGDAFDGANNTVPTVLDIAPAGIDTMTLTTAQAAHTTKLRVEHNDVTNVWNVNGKTWEDVIASGFKYTLATPEINEVQLWEIENSSGGWFHPVHIHLIDFRVISRNGQPPFGFEQGPKDVVYIGEKEKVRLLGRFAVLPGSSGGRYMVHCHNLVHEDHDMMLQFAVGHNDMDHDENDPIESARCVVDDQPADAPAYEPSYPMGT